VQSFIKLFILLCAINEQMGRKIYLKDRFLFQAI